ncbi:MAG TPA: hypothetical protein VFL36_09040 [Myxococcales bacterium]|nr:hypothetical protein [Myxococcales bacterium]
MQLRLADDPAVNAQLLPPLHPPLHEVPQAASVQLPPAHFMVQLLPAGSQSVFSQPLDPPQAHSAAVIRKAIQFMRSFLSEP